GIIEVNFYKKNGLGFYTVFLFFFSFFSFLHFLIKYSMLWLLVYTCLLIYRLVKDWIFMKRFFYILCA
ncbi:uncharacterized protein V2V93DRAFT_361927, partial [Kockiozyma suomiensis]|uniref:uncharacterized protein n=1 Tax=Kockiozyma suomiensis TaxID=1337062 RepID=UPI003343E08C